MESITAFSSVFRPELRKHKTSSALLPSTLQCNCIIQQKLRLAPQYKGEGNEKLAGKFWLTLNVCMRNVVYQWKCR